MTESGVLVPLTKPLLLPHMMEFVMVVETAPVVKIPPPIELAAFPEIVLLVTMLVPPRV